MESTPRHDLGRAIKRARFERNLSQTAVADVTGVTQSSVSAWERGEAWPALPVWFTLANLLGLDANLLPATESTNAAP